MGERLASTDQNLVAFSTAVNGPMPVTVKWKPKSFRQIVSAYQNNGALLAADPSSNYGPSAMKGNVLLPQPIRHYRKEKASVSIKYPYQPRTGVSIDEIYRPGGTTMINGYTSQTSLGLDKLSIDVKEAGEVNNKTQHPGTCTALCVLKQDVASNALKRVRRSGIVKQNYNTTAQQYLNNRNKSFQQNQYQFLQYGNTTAIPGTAAAQNNIYRTQSTGALYDASGVLSSCHGMRPAVTNVYYKPNNTRFATQGGVEGSAYLLRKKFDTITNNTAIFRKVYGNATASAMSYGGDSKESVYTYKDKVGYPLPRRIKAYRYPSRSSCCNSEHIAGGLWARNSAY